MTNHHVITWYSGNLDSESARQTFASNSTLVIIDCDMMSFGVWSGVRDLALQILNDLERDHHLIRTYDGTLYNILPECLDRINPRHLNLTDLSVGDERVRSYPMDRALRNVNGFVELYDYWCCLRGLRPELFLLNFDKASTMTRAFFKELVRRRGHKLELRLRVHSNTDSRESVDCFAELGWKIDHRPVNFPVSPTPMVDKEWAKARIKEIFAIIKADFSLAAFLYPEAIRLAKATDDQRHYLNGHQYGVSYCAHYGYYHDALFHADIIRPILSELADIEEVHFVGLVLSQVHAFMAIGRAQEIYPLLESAYQKTKDKGARVALEYILAMLHIRFLDVKDDNKADRLLHQAQLNLTESNLSADRKLFLSVFVDNGLALVRMRQGRVSESIEICKRGFALLAEGLPAETHRLHRSVLLYNISQVYYALKDHENARHFLTLAIEMDPHYSEYYNERGNVHQQSGNHEAAFADYQAAIERSGPFFEVYFNLGLCHKELAQYDQALTAFNRSLDLNPNQPAILLCLAQIHEEQGDWDEALNYYNAYLDREQDSDQLVNRAVILFQVGKAEAALSDLNRALALEPGRADYYRNRAIALAELGQPEEAKADLEAYLRLMPEAEDREEVLNEINQLCEKASLVS